ncbi:MAG: hypothetical protein DELT_00021 [Desulfovibrio sp.]
MRKFVLFSMLIVSIALGGCFNSGDDGASDPVSSGLTYYFDEFQDVPIPNEMKVDKKDTFITYSADGIKLGTQAFSGRVEMASLVNAMHSHMVREGWVLRSVFRSSRSIMIFEKPEKMCSVYIGEGMVNTGMLMFVSPKLQQGALQYSVPTSTSTEPAYSGDPVIGSATSASDPNVTVYPAK